MLASLLGQGAEQDDLILFPCNKVALHGAFQLRHGDSDPVLWPCCRAAVTDGALGSRK